MLIGTTWSVFQELGTDRTCLNHINWGWNGLCNGYFNGWIYDANNAEINDSGVGVDSGTNSAYVKDFEYFTVTH